MADRTKDFYEGVKTAQGCANQLEQMASAFDVLAQPKLAARLWQMVDDLREAINTMQGEFSGSIVDRCNESEQATKNMLLACMVTLTGRLPDDEGAEPRP